jgi:hypothetical protein
MTGYRPPTAQHAADEEFLHQLDEVLDSEAVVPDYVTARMKSMVAEERMKRNRITTRHLLLLIGVSFVVFVGPGAARLSMGLVVFSALASVAYAFGFRRLVDSVLAA